MAFVAWIAALSPPFLLDRAMTAKQRDDSGNLSGVKRRVCRVACHVSEENRWHAAILDFIATTHKIKRKT